MELMIEYLSLKEITALHKDEIKEAVNKVIESGWYLQGQALQHFEDAYAAYIGTSHCIGCGNGLDAIWLILRAYIELGVLKEGDEIIVPANTYIGTILPITQNRLKPVLIEPNIETAKALEKLGIDILHVSSGIPEDRKLKLPNEFEYNDFVYTGIQVKKNVNIPVIVVNDIKTLSRGNKLIEDGDCDFVAYGRPFLSDPNFVIHSLK